MTLCKTMTKLDRFKEWALIRKVYSTTDIKKYGLDNFYTSIDVRARIDLKDFHRRIPDEEAILRGLIKPHCKIIAWYEVLK